MRFAPWIVVLSLSLCACTPPPPAVGPKDPANYGPELERYLAASWTNSSELKKVPNFLRERSSGKDPLAALNPPGLPETTQIPESALRLTFLPPQGMDLPREPGWVHCAKGYVVVQFVEPDQSRTWILDYSLDENHGGEASLEINGDGPYAVSLLDTTKGLHLSLTAGSETRVIRLRLGSRLPDHGNFGTQLDVPPPLAIPEVKEGDSR